MEATGRYGDALAQWLHDQGHIVSVVNPLRIKSYARARLTRNKTDQVDTHRRGRGGSYPPPPRTDPGVRNYRTGLFRDTRFHNLTRYSLFEVGTQILNRQFSECFLYRLRISVSPFPM
jgi:transposase